MALTAITNDFEVPKSLAELLLESSACKADFPVAITPAFDNMGRPNFLDANGQPVAGVFADVPNDDYHAIPAVSSSKLKTFAKTPAHYKRAYLDSICRARTNAYKRTMDTGSHGHTLILEPELFYGMYQRDLNPLDYPNAISKVDELKAELKSRGLKTSGLRADLIARLHEAAPEVAIFDVLQKNHRDEFIKSQFDNIIETDAELLETAKLIGVSTEGKRDEIVEAILAKEPSVNIYEKCVEARCIDPIVWDDAHRILESKKRNPLMELAIKDGMAELTVIAKCKITGMWLKVKFDWLRFDMIAVDVKTSGVTASPDGFARQAANLRYDLQESFYTYVPSLLGIDIKAFAFAVVEYGEADIAEMYELDQRAKYKATKDLYYFLEEMKDCIDNDTWYGYTNPADGLQCTVLSLPAYHYK
ncbi:PD-(D/E)XK nuclease-like domain-containing protein [Motilimonas eburnea]|uniref:PD-(D/E)XK nuclease-like domain-containing protein n=1 Tax=Motilimonas eburnea TaxID=1737488 RepID=UPI001E642075|nr:PD-(D/E)XK nuclease-like domain-containing protein [Motilimonas eburnea]MCE2571731.1 PD-(D/E)XK nuclease-like domain-containing protein [Motilimonas eburnea]